jgi:hypothetical protein
MKKSEVCHLIQITPVVTDLLPTSDRFRLIKTYEDESHLFRYLLRCKRCGQLYFFEFYEEIDWENGDDPQNTTYIPINTAKEADALHALSPIELLAVTPRLQFDTGRGNSGVVRWVGKQE